MNPDCPECNYPDCKERSYKGTYTRGEPCPACNHLESSCIRIDVGTELGRTPLNADAGKDLFIRLLEAVMDDRDGNFELFFGSVVMMSQEFIATFFDTARESKQFPLQKFREQVTFSGLYLTDIEHISKALQVDVKEPGPVDPAEPKKNAEKAGKLLQDLMDSMSDRFQHSSGSKSGFDFSKLGTVLQDLLKSETE